MWAHLGAIEVITEVVSLMKRKVKAGTPRNDIKKQKGRKRQVKFYTVVRGVGRNPGESILKTMEKENGYSAESHSSK
jgi:hypothetical protein